MAMLVTNSSVPMTYAMERECIYFFLFIMVLTRQLASPFYHLLGEVLIRLQDCLIHPLLPA